MCACVRACVRACVCVCVCVRVSVSQLASSLNKSEAANGCGLQQFVVAIDHNVYEITERLITSKGRGISAVVINHLILLCVALVFIK